jgi:hypothetical protein
LGPVFISTDYRDTGSTRLLNLGTIAYVKALVPELKDHRRLDIYELQNVATSLHDFWLKGQSVFDGRRHVVQREGRTVRYDREAPMVITILDFGFDLQRMPGGAVHAETRAESACFQRLRLNYWAIAFKY